MSDSPALHAAGRTLDEQAGALESARSSVTSAVASTTWEAAAAARQRTQLAETDARARTAVDELRAAARHLGQLAGAVEELKQDMRAAWSHRHEGLQAELRRATADPLLATGAPELHRHLAQLPPPTDPYWSTQVDVAAVPLPQVAATRSDAPLGPHVPPTVVRVELAELRALAGALRREATTAADTRARAAVAVVLPLSRLDAFGLPGSRTGRFLAETTSSGSDHALTATGWSDSAARAAALADLVDHADTAGTLTDVLTDSRAETALDLAVLLASTSGDEEVGAALTEFDDEDALWLLDTVPGLEQRLSSSFPVLGSVDFLNGLALAPQQAGATLLRRGDQLGRDAKTLKAMRNQGTPAERTMRRSQRNAMLREMRAARVSGARFTGLTARMPGANALLRIANSPVIKGVPVLRSVPVLSVVLTGFGIHDDIENGNLSPTHAVVKNVGSTAAGLATTVLVTGAVAATVVGSVALAPIVIGIAAGAVVGYGVGKVIEHHEEVADWAGDRLQDTGKAMSNLGDGLSDGVGDAWNNVFG